MTAFTHALVASEAIPKYAEKLKLYGQFVGSWEAEAQAFLPDGATRRHYWQISFDWVLEGRAIQDVWITPPRHGAHADQSERWGPFDNQYGTSLRVYDPKDDIWRVTWIDPCSDFRADLIGRAQGGDGIFQEGTGSNGMLLRWIFSDITRDSFRWRAEISTDTGAGWNKAIDLLAKRT
jgi:hypothetical protein